MIPEENKVEDVAVEVSGDGEFQGQKEVEINVTRGWGVETELTFIQKLEEVRLMRTLGREGENWLNLPLWPGRQDGSRSRCQHCCLIARISLGQEYRCAPHQLGDRKPGHGTGKSQQCRDRAW